MWTKIWTSSIPSKFPKRNIFYNCSSRVWDILTNLIWGVLHKHWIPHAVFQLVIQMHLLQANIDQVNGVIKLLFKQLWMCCCWGWELIFFFPIKSVVHTVEKVIFIYRFRSTINYKISCKDQQSEKNKIFNANQRNRDWITRKVFEKFEKNYWELMKTNESYFTWAACKTFYYIEFFF